MAALLALSSVRKRFAALEGVEAPEILSGVDLTLERGESLAIVGPSGSGKSTLLNLCGGLDQPTSGSVRLAGEDLAQKTPDELAFLRNAKVGFIFQSHHLLPQCTALENVVVPTLVSRDKAVRAGAPERARKLLERVGLGARTHHRPAQLSGGECQRVAVVRALVQRPELVLADEPTGSLDPVSATELAELLTELNREEGTTLVVVTHSAELAQRMDRTLVLSNGVLAPPAAV